MSVMKSKNGNDIYLDCCCGCNEGLRIRIDRDDFWYYTFMSYTSGNFYRDQGDTVLRVVWKKMKKIWSIIKNKDFYHNEIVMTKDEFYEFREYINGIE